MAATPRVAHRDYELPSSLSGSEPNKLTCGVDDVPQDLEPRFKVGAQRLSRGFVIF